MLRIRSSFVISILFWAIMMCTLVARHHALAGSGAQLGLFAAIRNPFAAETWYGIFRNQDKLGYGETKVSGDVAGGAVIYRVDLYVRLRLPEEFSVRGEISMRDPGGIDHFSLQALGGGRRFSLNGGIQGDECLIEYDLGDSRGVPAGVKLSLRGMEGRTAILDEGEEIMNLRGVLSPARRYRVSSPWGELKVWIDERGVLLRMDAPGGFTVIQEPHALAKEW